MRDTSPIDALKEYLDRWAAAHLSCEHAHGGAETPCRGEIGDERIGHRRDRADAEAEQRREQNESRQAFAPEDQRKRGSAKEEARR